MRWLRCLVARHSAASNRSSRGYPILAPSRTARIRSAAAVSVRKVRDSGGPGTAGHAPHISFNTQGFAGDNIPFTAALWELKQLVWSVLFNDAKWKTKPV